MSAFGNNSLTQEKISVRNRKSSSICNEKRRSIQKTHKLNIYFVLVF